MHFMIPNASEWLETIMLRILNDNPSKEVLINQLINYNPEVKKTIKDVVLNLMKRNPKKFKYAGNEVLEVI